MSKSLSNHRARRCHELALAQSLMPGARFAVRFGVTADGKSMKAATRAGVMVLSYDIIYDLVRDIEQAMKTTLPMRVPIVVEMGTGDNWLDAH